MRQRQAANTKIVCLGHAPELHQDVFGDRLVACAHVISVDMASSFRRTAAYPSQHAGGLDDVATVLARMDAQTDLGPRLGSVDSIENFHHTAHECPSERKHCVDVQVRTAKLLEVPVSARNPFVSNWQQQRTHDDTAEGTLVLNSARTQSHHTDHRSGVIACRRPPCALR